MWHGCTCTSMCAWPCKMKACESECASGACGHVFICVASLVGVVVMQPPCSPPAPQAFINTAKRIYEKIQQVWTPSLHERRRRIALPRSRISHPQAHAYTARAPPLP